MIRDEARELREIRDALKEYESSQLAGIAETLARTAESLARATAELDRGGEWLTPEQAAEYLGYISEDRQRSVKAFEKAAYTAGIPKHYITPRVYRYSRREIDNWLLDR